MSASCRCWSSRRRSSTYSSRERLAKGPQDNGFSPDQGPGNRHGAGWEMEDRFGGRRMSDKNEHVDGRPASGGAATGGGSQREKRRLMVTQILRSPVLNQTGEELGRLEDLIVKLDRGGGGSTLWPA